MQTTSSPAIGQLPSPSGGVPAAVQDAVDRPRFFSDGDLYEAHEEIAIATRKQRLPRGLPAARRTFVAAKAVVASLQALGEAKWAHRLSQCSSSFWTVGCPGGHGGAVVTALTKRCGLPCCPTCTRLMARRLSRELTAEMKLAVPQKGQRWRFLTLSLQPRATFKDAWDDICHVRTKALEFLKGINGGVHPPAVAAIEFGRNGHPHLHILYLGPFVVRDALSRLLVRWTGGTVVDLPESQWVPVGKPTKRGQRYRTWKAVPPAVGVGGDWYVDVREVKGGLRRGVAEVAKYLADPFGGAGDVRDPQQKQLVVAASRNSAAIAVAGKGRHRVQGYGSLKGIVGRALGKKRKPSPGPVVQPNGTVKGVGFCSCCSSRLVVVQKADRDALAYFNRNRLAALATAPPH